MAIRYGLTAAALFLLSASNAFACDDFAEEAALAAARQAKPVQEAEASQMDGKGVVAVLPAQPETMDLAAAAPMADLTTSARSSESVRQ